MNTKILRLNKTGLPVSWLTREETATLVVKELVIWSLGNTVMEIRGVHGSWCFAVVLRGYSDYNHCVLVVIWCLYSSAYYESIKLFVS